MTKDEDRCYEGACFSNEFEAACDLSKREMARDDKGKIARLVSEGRHVVYLAGPVYCGFTDALIIAPRAGYVKFETLPKLGESRTYIADFATENEALEALEQFADEDYGVASPAKGYRLNR